MKNQKYYILEPKSGVQIIQEERERQVTKEGWSPSHDDEHTNSELAKAAAIYALPSSIRNSEELGTNVIWPFEEEWLKESPEDRIKELSKAGALIAAEIDRLMRENGKN